MNNLVKTIKHLADEIREADRRMAEEVRQNAKESQEASQRMLEAIHCLHNILFLIPDKLVQIAERLEKS